MLSWKKPQIVKHWACLNLLKQNHVNNEYFFEYSQTPCYKVRMDSTTENIEDTRQRILEAAEERFSVYGYNKTTMAEIAKDCCMSAANLYRYFENKQDIGAASAQQCMTESTALLREVVRKPGLSSSQRLEEFVLTLLRHTHSRCADQPKINELVATISHERKDIVHNLVQAEQALITEILSEGNRSGEFDVEDVVKTAEYVHAAMVKFGVPIFMGLYPLDEFETKAIGVTRLLIKGLKNCNN